jgi:hypothetical protein
MMTADALARELGCTLADLDGLGIVPVPCEPQDEFDAPLAHNVRVAWSMKTGIDYTETVK